MTVQRMDDAQAATIKGGQPGTEDREEYTGMWADVLVEVDANGNRIWEWRAAEHLDPARHVVTFNDLRDEWSHGNTVVPLGDDRVMFSFRNISTVGIIDKASGDIVWQIGDETLSQQHDPSLLDNGNVLIYDNGSHNRFNPLPASRVIEVDTSTNEIVWEYRDNPPFNFFSAYISGARRLPNGNTLITEGQPGRIFQVTPDGQVVWEYVNPHFAPNEQGFVVNSVFRSTHYLPEQAPQLR